MSPTLDDVTPRQAQIAQLRDQGYVVVPGFAPAESLIKLNEAARVQPTALADSIEFDADLHYPGAPPSRTAAGGGTVSRPQQRGAAGHPIGFAG